MILENNIPVIIYDHRKQRNEYIQEKRRKKMKGKIYAQLYSILKTNQKRSLEALRQLSEIGYDGVELMGTNTCGMSNDEYKKLIQDLHLDPISSHNLKTEEDFAWGNEMGVRYTDIRADLGEGSYDDVMKACEEMNRQGKLRAGYGIKAVLHNHSQEFRKVKGMEEKEERIYDVLIQNTDPEYVNFELDCGWCAFSGCDPTEYVRKYPERFPVVHVKEALRRAYCDDELEHFPMDVLKLGMPVSPVNPKAAKEGFLADINLFTEEQASIMYWSRHWNGRLGDGIIDWKALSDALEVQGVEAYICEREYYSYEGGGTAYICAQQDYEYLKQLPVQ